jgi:predicted lipid-binding transport protein (Tim44 family)
MNQVFDPLNLLILAIAVVIFFKLRSVLGRRTGHERPPVDFGLPKRAENRNMGDVTPPIGREPPPAPAEPAEPVWTGFADKGTPLAENLEKIVDADPRFSPKSFLEGAKLAYEMIVTAFAQGDKSSLKNLLSREVYEGFAGAIDAREKAGEKMESRFVGIDKADIVSAEMSGRRVMVTVKFISQLISATLDRAGEVIDGDPKQIREVIDVWTFERDVSSRDPNWRLVATGD